MRALFQDYQEKVDAIVMLRTFRTAGIAVRYQLVEIPTSLFASVQDAPLDVFRSDAPVIRCSIDGQDVATVATDRSDAKITIRNIRLSACIVHAEWIRNDLAR